MRIFSWGSKAFGLHGHLHACAHTHTEIHVTKRSNKPFEKEKVGAGSWVRTREEAVKQLQKERKQERRQCPGHKGGIESHVSSPEPKPKMLLRIGESSLSSTEFIGTQPSVGRRGNGDQDRMQSHVTKHLLTKTKPEKNHPNSPWVARVAQVVLLLSLDSKSVMSPVG